MNQPALVCPKCQQAMKQTTAGIICPNGCDRVTARVPKDGRPSHESLGEGCFIKRKAVID